MSDTGCGPVQFRFPFWILRARGRKKRKKTSTEVAVSFYRLRRSLMIARNDWVALIAQRFAAPPSLKLVANVFLSPAISVFVASFASIYSAWSFVSRDRAFLGGLFRAQSHHYSIRRIKSAKEYHNGRSVSISRTRTVDAADEKYHARRPHG